MGCRRVAGTGRLMSKQRVLIFVVSYNHEAFIETVLKRIPEKVWDNHEYDVEVLVIDDQSRDNTFDRALDYVEAHPHHKVKVLYSPVNQGYGGNQKLGYHYAIQQGFDAVILLHGDGQYAPELLDDMVRPLLDGNADVVFGSRMINRMNALKGRMPMYKWVGNQVLTFLQNKMLRSNLSEFHTGYRAYSIKALKRVPFHLNSNYFDFDTDIIIQMLGTGQRIAEIAIPTFYGDEISYVNGWRYGLLILLTTLRSRIVRLGLLYDVRFDYERINEQYSLKSGYPSSHQFALDRVNAGAKVLDLGSGTGYVTKALHDRGAEVISVDRYIHPAAALYSVDTFEAEVEALDLDEVDLDQLDIILMLDIIQRLKDPEGFMLKLRRQYARHNPPKLIITTANVGFFIPRLMLLLGQFNYANRGILDRDHRRLFTFASLKRLLSSTGYDVLEVHAIPAPYPLAIGDNFVSRSMLAINRVLNKLLPGVFAYQMAFVVRPRPTIEHLLANAEDVSEQKRAERV
jgi:glycosyltransferase involved in cell wall biosynthesis